MEIRLTNGGVALVSDEDYPALSAVNWQRHKYGYAYRCTSRNRTRRCILMHREIIAAPPGTYVDHIDGNPANNQRDNLRLCSQSQNLANRQRQSNNRGSRFKGVSYSPSCRARPWRVRCQREDVGWFASEEEAAHAYDRAALERYGEFAVLNADKHGKFD